MEEREGLGKKEEGKGGRLRNEPFVNSFTGTGRLTAKKRPEVVGGTKLQSFPCRDYPKVAS